MIVRIFAMRSGVVLLAISVSSVLPGLAAAQEWYTGAREKAPETTFGAAIDASLSGTTRGSLHGSLIGTIAPFSKLDESGMRLRLGGLLGNYAYTSVTPGVGRVNGRESSGSLMAGYEWVTRNATFSIYLGGEVQNRTLSKVDPSNNVVGTAWGFKTSVDFYMNPTSYTMASGNITYSTVNNAYYTRFKVGMAVTERIFVGPEMLFLGDNFYGQWRAGAHITGARVGPMQFGLSGGYVNDRRGGPGGYGIFDARLGF